MPLSEEEQRVLDQLERQLRAEDPNLAQSMRGQEASAPNPVRKLAIALSGVVVGLILLIGGVASQNPWIGIVGFVLMFAVVVYATLSPSGKTKKSGEAHPKSAPAKDKSGIVDKMDERWNRRFDDN